MNLNRVEKCDDLVPVRKALMSCADKTNLDILVRGLIDLNPRIRIYSTGGTYSCIEEILGGSEKAAGTLVAVSEYTGQPEMQGGLVKTLDFRIYMGLLSETYNEDHQNDLKRCNAEALDLVVVNLYPFEQTVAAENVTLEDARTNIDIGGPCMLRASAKNFLRVLSVCNPADYSGLLAHLKSGDGASDLDTRFAFARKSFSHTAAYDAAIQKYLFSRPSAKAEGLYSLQ